MRHNSYPKLAELRREVQLLRRQLGTKQAVEGCGASAASQKKRKLNRPDGSAVEGASGVFCSVKEPQLVCLPLVLRKKRQPSGLGRERAPQAGGVPLWRQRTCRPRE